MPVVGVYSGVTQSLFFRMLVITRPLFRWREFVLRAGTVVYVSDVRNDGAE